VAGSKVRDQISRRLVRPVMTALHVLKVTDCSCVRMRAESDCNRHTARETRRLPMRGLSILALAAVVLAGCGTSHPNREVGGAATGAGTGAVIGILGGPIGVVAGALIGAGAGAATGVAVSPGHVNLGPPPWTD